MYDDDMMIIMMVTSNVKVCFSSPFIQEQVVGWKLHSVYWRMLEDSRCKKKKKKTKKQKKDEEDEEEGVEYILWRDLVKMAKRKRTFCTV